MRQETGAAQAARGAVFGALPWLLLALTWFACVQVRPLLDPDEGRYAEIPREMVESGDWLTPRLDGLHYFEKPPLQYWATAVAYRLFGQYEWSARLWTVGLAFLCLPLVCAWAGRLGGPRAGLVALTALAVCPLFAVLGHLNMLDAGFSFWLSCTLAAFCCAQDEPAGSLSARRWMLAAWAAAALAVLTKGIVVGVLGGASLALYSLAERDWRIWGRLSWLSGGALFLALTLPWFLLMQGVNPGFLQFFLVHEHFERFLTKVHHRVEPWWFFLPLLLLGVLPFVMPLVRGARLAWRGDGTARAGVFKPLKFLLIFAGVTLVFFSASGSKLPPYILPMLPPLAVIVGVHAAQQESFFRGAARVGAVLVALSAASILAYCVHRNDYIPEVVNLWAGVALAAAGVGVALTWRREPPILTGPGPALVTASAAVLAWQALLNQYTFMPAVRSARDLAAAVRPYVHDGTPLYSIGQYRETLSPYLKRRLQVVDFKGELQRGIEDDPGLMDMNYQKFESLWSAGGSAVAFFDPHLWASHRAGFPGRVVAADAYTVAVVRP
jgi:4-amino-4-deoxy-L-arabinose transferase-like glycosyltransferase